MDCENRSPFRIPGVNDYLAGDITARFKFRRMDNTLTFANPLVLNKYCLVAYFY